MNLLEISLYASDARVRQLPLLGGDSSGHDWNNVLSYLGTLDQTATIAGAIRIAGYLIMLLALYLSLKNSTYLIAKKT